MEKLRNGQKLISNKFIVSKMSKKGKKINFNKTANFLKLRIFCFFSAKKLEKCYKLSLITFFRLKKVEDVKKEKFLKFQILRKIERGIP